VVGQKRERRRAPGRRLEGTHLRLGEQGGGKKDSGGELT
jgi:hypothetical protein